MSLATVPAATTPGPARAGRRELRDGLDVEPPVEEPGTLRATFRAMASGVDVCVVRPGPSAAAALAAVEDLFRRVEASCTRFDPDSPLMRANAAGEEWATVPVECFRALVEAAHAHRRTGGLFEPRVLDDLVSLGYDRSLPFREGPVQVTSGRPATVAGAAGSGAGGGAAGGAGRGIADPSRAVRRWSPWRPGLDAHRSAVRIGPRPVDLGGIGKGLAVRWAAELLARAGEAFLVEAGGDCHLGGRGPDGDGWRVAVEDPFGGGGPVAVLDLADTGCATSSLRVRAWQLDGRTVHHIVDPRTGDSATTGVRSVTVAGVDAATAEVWSKALLVAGRHRIAELARERALAVLWVTDDGELGASPAMFPALLWTAQELAAS